MSIKNTIANNGILSATFNGKTFTRRESNGVVFYDISGGGASSSGGGANVTTDPNAPTGGSDGDLWYDETNGSLYVYTDSINGWIQTNGGAGGAGGASVSTGDVVPANPADGDLWFDESVSELYTYLESQTAWVQTNGGAGAAAGGGVSEVINIAAVDDDYNRHVTNNPVPEGEWLVHFRTADVVHSDKYVVPSGQFLHFLTTGSMTGEVVKYAITTSTTPPEGTQSVYGWISISSELLDNGKATAINQNNFPADIYGFALKLGSGGGTAGGDGSAPTPRAWGFFNQRSYIHSLSDSYNISSFTVENPTLTTSAYTFTFTLENRITNPIAVTCSTVPFPWMIEPSSNLPALGYSPSYIDKFGFSAGDDWDTTHFFQIF